MKDNLDGLSDLSTSVIDGTEENHTELDHLELETDILINNIRKLIEENKEEL